MGEGRNGKRSFVDTNIFLYAIQKHPKFGETSKKILEKIDRGEEEAVTSIITLAEVCWWLEKHKKTDEIKEKIELILSIFNLKIVNPDCEDFLKGAELTRRLGINFNDCLNLALMERLEIDEIYSNDSDFEKMDWIERKFD